MICGGEPVPAALLEQFMHEIPQVVLTQGYGMSEFPSTATLLQPEEALTRAGSCGQPTSITRIAIGHQDGTISEAGEGELLIRSPATTIGYHGLPEKTAQAFAGGWFHTGDLGVIDEDGYARITGRLKDMIITGGLNVYPKEAEELLLARQDISEAAVVGVPDHELGEISVAVIVTDDPVQPDELISYCKAQLATYKTPKAVLVHDGPLPRSANGKLLKRELRPWAAAKLRRQVS
jgi:fatty-acyl-CoA synthase